MGGVIDSIVSGEVALARYISCFKYLGMFCDKNSNLNKAAEEALKPAWQA